MSDASRMYSLLVDPRFSNRPRTRALALGLLAERLKHHAEPPTETDQQATICHYVDHGIGNSKHSLAHIKRLCDPEVKNSPDAVAFAEEHASHHGEESLAAWEHMDDFLSKYPSDPVAYRAAKAKLQQPAGDDDDSDSEQEDEEKSSPVWFLPPAAA